MRADKDNVPSLMLRPRDAARALAVSERTLWAVTAPRGTLPCVRIGERSVRYLVEDLVEWARENRRGSGPAVEDENHFGGFNENCNGKV